MSDNAKNVYCIGRVTNVCHGHGDYRDEVVICAPGLNDHYPAFKTYDAAVEFLRSVKAGGGIVVVELEMKDV